MITDKLNYKSQWTVRKFDPTDDMDSEEVYRAWRDGVDGCDPTETNVFDGNVLLNEGITALQNLLTDIGSETAFSNAAAYLGVGDDNTTAGATDTGLLAATNKDYQPMETSYPSISDQTTTWRSVWTTAEANWAWNEFTVANGSSNAADNLNRKVESQGTKQSGQTWTLDLSITWS